MRGSIKSKKRAERLANIIAFVFIILFASLVMFPLWWIFRSSLMTNPEIGSLNFFPSRWYFSNYPEALQVFTFFQYFFNTMTIVVPCVVFGTVTAVLCGYSFARLYFRGRSFVFGLCIASLLLPPIVTLIPLYIVWMRFLGLGGTYWPLILPYLTGGGAFNIFLIRQFIMTVPRELDEAAKIDGAGRLRVLLQILVPSIRPAIIVVALFIFIGIWNDVLLQTVYISDSNMYTIALGLRKFSGSYGTDWKLAMASTCLSILPGIIVYLVCQKYFVEGIVMTGMKN
jgi:multiple sugar transport system permease protein